MHFPRCALPGVIVACLALLGAGCSDDAPTATDSAAKAATPSPAFAMRSSNITVEKADPRPRSTRTMGGAGEGADENAVAPSVSVQIEAEPDSGGAPLAVSFVGEINADETVSGLRYRWDFGDGSAPGSGLKVEHTYFHPGEYSATFTASGPGVQESQNVTITVEEEGFDLDIEADPDVGAAPLTVHLSPVLDEELPGPFSFRWEFGDGGQDVSGSTSHTYRFAGEYTATLTATNSRGQWAQRTVQIQVDAPEPAQ